MIIDELPPDVFPALRRKRFFNYLIDLLPASAITLLIDYFLEAMIYVGQGEAAALAYRVAIDGSEDITLNTILLSLFVGVIGNTLYYMAFEYGLNGKTLGKYLTRTRAISQDGTPMTFAQALSRSLIRMVPMEPLSFFMGNSLTGWHDNWSQTLVIDEP